MIDLFLSTVAATEAFGRALARTRPSRGMVQLCGDLGAGKSTLARAMLRALGVEGPIRSPTYTLIERYRLAEAGEEVWHLDLYRIAHAGELDFLGLDDGLDEAVASLWLVEWPEHGAGALPPADLTVALTLVGEGRGLLAWGESEAGCAWQRRLQQNHELQELFASPH